MMLGRCWHVYLKHAKQLIGPYIPILSRNLDFHFSSFQKPQFRSFFGTCLDVQLEVSKWLGSVGYNLLINGVYWGYNPLILTNLLTSWDIQGIPHLQVGEITH